jgi:Trypsin
MNKLLLAFYSIAAFSIAVDAILNGDRVSHKSYYARISYRVREGNPATIFYKSGCVISDRFILTTNEFFGNATDFEVWVGSSIRGNQKSYYAGGVMRLTSNGFGPALIQLIEPLTFSLDVGSIRLIPSEANMGLDNEQGMVLGFGLAPQDRNTVQAAFMRISSNCSYHFPLYNQNAIFCAQDPIRFSDFCGEDRGSAMTVLSRNNEYLVGLAAFSECSPLPHGRPSLFVRMAFYVDRINQIIENITT